MTENDGKPKNEIPAYDNSGESGCEICSHPGCPHFHSRKTRLSKVEVQEYMRWRESTLLTKHSRREMPPSITSFPLEFDVHCISVLKYDGLVMGPHYDREWHLAQLPLVRAEQQKKREERRRKLSDAAKRRAKARRSLRTEKKK